MLPEPDRYVYSAITSRPSIQLPDGAKVALWIVSNNEFYELNPPIGGVRRPWPRVQPDVLAYSHRDYGNRVGLWRLISLLDSYGLRASVSLNVALCDHYPETTEACLKRNWEFFAHGVYNTRYLFELTEDDERSVIQDCVDTIYKYTGKAPVGWLSPALTNTERTLDLLPEFGFTYTCDLFHDDQPFPVKVAKGRLISMPYTLDLNDVVVFASYLHTPEYYGQMIRDQFDTLLAEGGESGRIMCISLHPYLIGQPHRLRYLDEALKYILSHSGVWATTGAEIAEWYMAHCYEQVLSAVGAK